MLESRCGGGHEKELTEPDSVADTTGKIWECSDSAMGLPTVLTKLRQAWLESPALLEGSDPPPDELEDQEKLLRPTVRTVKRSFHEQKDRGARERFTKELEEMEIDFLETKEKFKPRRMKKELKKTSCLYETVQTICRLPDSHSSASRGNTSWPSVATIGSTSFDEDFGETSSKATSHSGSAMEDKLQLRKDGSRASLTGHEAFLQVKLSEEPEENPSGGSQLSTASSPTELLSTSSEISLRVNRDQLGMIQRSKRQRPNTLKSSRKEPNKVNLRPEKGIAQETVIIERIVSEFGEWAKENGLKPEVVQEDVVRELFQFGTMDQASNSISVEIKELIVVPEIVTEGNHLELGERAAFYRQILFDELAYWRTERSSAFSRPHPRPYKRPTRTPLDTWTHSGFIPFQLVTGELLFQTLIDSGSLMLEKFVLWMIQNREVFRPPFLVNGGYIQRIVDKYGGSESAIRQDIATSRALSIALDKETVRLIAAIPNRNKKTKM